ncbi:MAG: glutamate racemase [Clostridiales bacterium]|nr:glutamate racemase [Clostridiales bacterium]
MDNRPIGVFDSGLGGLTAVRELRRMMPSEDIIYFGDTSRVPYGSRSRETILKYARQDTRFLRGFDLKAILIACGTVSTTSLDTLKAENDIPMLGVVEPTCRRAVAMTKNKRVGLIATAASVRSGAYERTIRAFDPTIEVISRACPLFVPLVENGRFRPGDVVIETVAREYLGSLRGTGIDTLILGCTHYPLLMEVIGGVMGPDVTLINAGEESAWEMKRALRASDALADPGRAGEAAFYASDRVEDFEKLAGMFLQEDLRRSVNQIDIETY